MAPTVGSSHERHHTLEPHPFTPKLGVFAVREALFDLPPLRAMITFCLQQVGKLKCLLDRSQLYGNVMLEVMVLQVFVGWPTKPFPKFAFDFLDRCL